MRNLRILNRGELKPESRTYPDLHVLTACFDVITDSITVVLGSPDSDTLEIQQFLKDGSSRLLASFPPTAPNDTIVSFAHFVDLTECVLVFSSGDIVTANYMENMSGQEPDLTAVEIVGSIDAGISCAAWSPDEESLALLTNAGNVVLLSRMFEPVAETHMEPQDLQMTTQVSVGWGKKETQFRGKGARANERQRLVLKHAGLNLDSDTAVLHDPTVKDAEYGTMSANDDGEKKRISWRGDGKHFAVVSIDTAPSADHTRRRVVRVYSRDGKLESSSEPVDGLEGNLSWKPQGSVLACTQRRWQTDPDTAESFESLSVVFLERNGLRHLDFDTRMGPETHILDIDWSCNSEVLALRLSHSVQIWATKNYHWYLKQELVTPKREAVEFVKFHAEKPLRIMVGTQSGVHVVDMTYNITRGSTCVPTDVGMTLVADGTTCMLTPLARAHVPPPACFREVDVDEPIVDMAVSGDNETMAILTNEALYTADADLHIKSKLQRSDFCDGLPRQVAITANGAVCVVYDSDEGCMFAFVDAAAKSLVSCRRAEMGVVSLKHSSYECVDGSVHLLSDGSQIDKFPQLCPQYDFSEVESQQYVAFGLTANGKLYVGSRLLCSGATSMLVTDSYLLYTTAQHELEFLHLNSTLLDESQPLEQPVAEAENDERSRMIERGSWLVSAVPSKASVTLQAPRGNLETIFPRIMVLSGVRRDIKQRKYRDAFMICRTHRIALDILHDYDPELFFANVQQFVRGLGKVEYLDLFLSCLVEENVAETKYKETDGDEKAVKKESNKVQSICDAVLEVLLLPKYKEKYLQSIITAYACQRPPKTAEALTLIGGLEEAEKEKCVQHLCFLLDVNRIYEVALGIYDIPLALVVAQQSQKDPKEYLPFLQNLHSEKENRRKFLVDSYLKKYEGALEWLIKVEGVANEEILEYVVEHGLYKHALGLYRYNEPQFHVVLRAYADWLHSSQKYFDAGLAYDKLGEYKLALGDYISGKKWQEAMSTALRMGYSGQQLEDVASDLVTRLEDAHEYSAAGYLEYKYLHDVEKAVECYCKSYEFERAILTCYEEAVPSKLLAVVDRSLGEQFAVIAELVAECRGQSEAQLGRLRELRAKKQSDPFAFYAGTAENAENADNVSIAATESTLRSSVFTRYTGKSSSTAKTGASRRTAKNRRREERKRARGKKGTIYEEEYLVRSTGRMVERLNSTVADAQRLVEGLVRRQMVEQAHEIQDGFVRLQRFVRENLKEVYTMSAKDRERVDDHGEPYLIPEMVPPPMTQYHEVEMLEY